VRRPPAPGRLPLVTKIVYGLGDWGNTTTSTIFIFFFAFFLTDVARLPSNLAALVLLVGGIWDAVSDPLIGVLADWVRTRWGRRRPFFLFNSLPWPPPSP
jgi:Na+/melibiose symporter-like transporter